MPNDIHERQSPLKAKPLRNPGQSVEEEIHQIVEEQLIPAYWVAAIFVFVALLEWIAYWQRWPRQPVLWTFIAGVPLGYFIWRFFRDRKKLRSLRLGRDGERAMSELLQKLVRAGARVLHDIPGENFNLDHVILSTHGIFVVETKTHSKPWPNARVTFEGDQVLVAEKALDRDPVQQVRAQVSWLSQLLESSTGKQLSVRGVVVFPGWYVEPMTTAMKRDIWVLEPKALPAFISQEQPMLSAEDVALATYHLSRYVRSKEADVT